MSEENTEEVTEEVEEAEPESSPQPPKRRGRNLDKVVDEVLRGEWGTGQDRRLRLSEAGFDHREVQAALVKRANHR